MTLRQRFLPLQPEFDRFLFATVGDEIDGTPLSVISALTRLGLDPWQEAGRLSSMSYHEAVEQLARLIAEVPGGSRQRQDACKIAGTLVALLPTREAGRSVPQIQIRPHFGRLNWPSSAQLWAVIFLLAVAVVVSAIFHGTFPFGIGSP
ncbi:MAG TPA: hypothetical protein VMF32_08360 [Xanthobacteraceae bacterium]|nr:hypothetical protein [Xanthobacteraceae bacterium]